MMKSEEKLILFISYVLLGVILTFFLTINFLTPPMGEDFAVIAYPPDSPPSGILELFQSVIQRIYLQMTTWNARIGDQLATILSCIDSVAFDILNSVVALYYFRLVLLYAYRGHASKRQALWCVFASFVMTVLFQPALGEIFFWMDGCTNYLWALCILLTFAYPAYCLFSTEQKDVIGTSFLKAALLTILGFFAGISNENTVVVILIIYGIILISCIIKKQKAPVWLYTSLLTVTLGYLFLLKAPSTGIRIVYYNRIFGTDNMKMIDYIKNVPRVIVRFWHDNNIIVMIASICIIAAVIVEIRQTHTEGKMQAIQKIGLTPFFALLLSSVSCGALIMSPYIETRSFFLPDFFMIVCIVYYSERFFSAVNKKELLSISIFALSCGFLICFVSTFNKYRDYHAFCERRNIAIASSNDVFLWGEYPSPCTSRVLTTREDYCMENQYFLNTYFGKEIKTVNGYIWGNNLLTKGYVRSEAIGSIDWANYYNNEGRLDVGGWGSLYNTAGKNNEIYLYFDNGDQRVFFKTSWAQERPDVASALGDNRQTYTGFHLTTYLPEEFDFHPSDGIGICVISRGKHLLGEIKVGTIAEVIKIE